MKPLVIKNLHVEQVLNDVYCRRELDFYYLFEYCPAFNLFPNNPSNYIYLFKSRDPGRKNEKKQIIRAFAKCLSDVLGYNNITLIPMPTSRPNNYYEDYKITDKRLVNLCYQTIYYHKKKVRKLNKDIICNTFNIFDVKKYIGQKSNGNKINPKDLYANIKIKDDLIKNTINKWHENIILIDDVITSGTNFRLCKMRLERYLQKKQKEKSFRIIGVFLGKTTHLKNNINGFKNWYNI